MERLTVVDEIFLRTHRGMGTPIALQGLWRTTDAMEPALLHAIHDRLRHGRLGRRVVNPRIPGARRGWQPTTRAHPVDLLPNSTESGVHAAPSTPAPRGDRPRTAALPDLRTPTENDRHRVVEAKIRWPATSLTSHGSVVPDDTVGRAVGPLAEHDILAWADTLGTDLDPEHSPGWRLSAARLDDGGTVVAVTCSHALADARGLIHAITTALNSSDPSTAPARRAASPIPTSTPPSDWADARAQWATIITGTTRALRQGIPRPPETTTPVTTADRTVHSTLRTFDAHHWNAVAAATNGTPNSLFIHLVANILWHTGFTNPTITASLPVDTRDEPRVDNDLAMTEIDLHRTDTPGTVREKAKAAYQRRMSSPAGLPEQILQVLPDRAAYALSKGAGERDILCSNIGPLPAAVRTVGPHDCTRVAARAIHPDLTAFPRTRLEGYLSQLDNTYTLALVSLSATDSLDTAIELACKATDLRPNPW